METLYLLTRLSALIGTFFLCCNFILATRMRSIERFVGGLDVLYKWHKASGILAFSFLLAHPILLGMLGNFKTYFIPGTFMPYNYGILALYTLILLVLLTFFKKLPYHIWKYTHKFMGLVLLFGLLHIFYIKSDISQNLILRGIILFCLLIAIFSYLYKQFLYNFFEFKHKYVIKKITMNDQFADIIISPKKNPINFAPGQFIFLKIKQKHLSKEEHPFSIASPPKERNLRIIIKKLGDYTKDLHLLKIGDKVEISDPHGLVYENVLKKKNVVCIAGGIGITPFLSIFSTKILRNSNFTLIYSVKNEKQAHLNKELMHLSSKLKFEYVFWDTEKDGRLTANKVHTSKETTVYLCGPSYMMRDLKKQFIKKGVQRRNIKFEDFSFK